MATSVILPALAGPPVVSMSTMAYISANILLTTQGICAPVLIGILVIRTGLKASIIRMVQYLYTFFSSEWTNLIWEKLERWGQATIKMLPNLALAVLVFTAFYLLAKLTKKLVYKLSCRLSHKQAISNLLAGVAWFIVFAIGLFTSLEILKLDKAVSSLLAGAGIIGLALGFAFQDLTSNFISGIYITFRKPFDVGHVIETNGFTGSVENIQFRSTTMRTFDGLHLIIPNKDIFQKPSSTIPSPPKEK